MSTFTVDAGLLRELRREVRHHRGELVVLRGEGQRHPLIGLVLRQRGRELQSKDGRTAPSRIWSAISSNSPLQARPHIPPQVNPRVDEAYMEGEGSGNRDAVCNRIMLRRPGDLRYRLRAHL